MSGGTLPGTAPGVRPSPGAAISACNPALEYFNAPARSRLAAPGDGRTPGGVRTKFLHCFAASGLYRPVCMTDFCCTVEKLCSDPATREASGKIIGRGSNQLLKLLK